MILLEEYPCNFKMNKYQNGTDCLGLKLGRHLGAIQDYPELSWTATGIEFASPPGPEVGVARHFCVISASGLEIFPLRTFTKDLSSFNRVY
jgi:hypothetical protein